MSGSSDAKGYLRLAEGGDGNPPAGEPDGTSAASGLASPGRARAGAVGAYDLPLSALKRRRASRLVWWAMMLGSTVLVLWLLHLPMAVVDISKRFDPAALLSLDVRGCDIHVEPAAEGAAAELRLRGRMSTTRVSWQSRDGEAVYYAHVRSDADCRELPFMQCAEACLLTVYVPSSAQLYELHVTQDEDDPSPWLQLRARDVSFRTLRIRGLAGNFWDFTGRTMDVSLRSVAVERNLLVSLSGGSLRCDQCAIGVRANVDVRATAGSVSIDAWLPEGSGPQAAAGGSELELNVRQPMNYICVATEATTAEAQFAGPLPRGARARAAAVAKAAAAAAAAAAEAGAEAETEGVFPPEDVWGSCAADEWVSQLTYELYDSNRDHFVDRQEFLDGLQALPYCCSSGCPFYSWCDPLSWQIFPTLTAASESAAGMGSRSGVLGNAAFLRSVLANTNLTGLLVDCRQRISVRQLPSPSLLLGRTPEPTPSLSMEAIEASRETPPSPSPATQPQPQPGSQHALADTDDPTASSPANTTPVLAPAHSAAHSAVHSAAQPTPAWRLRPTTSTSSSLQLPAAHVLPSSPSPSPPPAPAPPSPSPPATAPPPPPPPPPSTLGLAQPQQQPQPQHQPHHSARGHSSLLPAKWAAVDSEGGQVHITLRRAHNSTWSRAPSSAVVWPPTNPGELVRYFAPAERYGGLRMLSADARMLQKEVGPRFGDLSSLGQGYIVFDVPPAPGVPRSLWVYATAPVYHVLEPALLAHLSLGTLVPTLLRFRVRFHNAECSAAGTLGRTVPTPCAAAYMLGATSSRPALGQLGCTGLEAGGECSRCSEMEFPDHAERLRAIHAGLTRAIKSDGKDSRRPRGEVYLVSSSAPRARGEWWHLSESHALFYFTSAPDSASCAPPLAMVPVGASRLSFVLHCSVVLSVLSALVLALGAEVALYRAAELMMRRDFKSELSRLRVLKGKGLLMEPSDALHALHARADDSGGTEAAGSTAPVAAAAAGAAVAVSASAAAAAARETAPRDPSFSVFEQPLVFISAFFIRPARRASSNSFKLFVRDACELDAQAARARHFRGRGGGGRGGGGGSGAGGAERPVGGNGGAEGGSDERQRQSNLSRPQTALSAVITQFELFCFQRDLDITNSRDELQRSLIGTYDCRVSVLRGVRFEGLVWKPKGRRDEPSAAGRSAQQRSPSVAPSAASPPSPPASAAAAKDAGTPLAAADTGTSPRPHAGAAEPLQREASDATRAAASELASSADAIRAFVRARCEVQPGGRGSISDEALEGDAQPGLGGELRAYCAARGLRAPSALETAAILSELGAKPVETTRRVVHGLSLRTEGLAGGGVLERFAMEGLAVLVHFWLLVLPGLVLLLASVYAQDVFAVTTATSEPLLWQHFFEDGGLGPGLFRELFTSDGGQILPTVRCALLEMLLFVLCTWVHMFLHYAGAKPASRLGAFKRVCDRCYAVVLAVHVLLLLLHVAINCTWCVLAAILDPTNFLPTGTAVAVGVFVIVSTRRELMTAALSLRQLLSSAFEEQLQETMRKTKAAIDSERHESQLRQLGLDRALLAGTASGLQSEDAPPLATGASADASGAKSAALSAAGSTAGSAKSAGKLSPSDVFALLTRDEKAMLTTSEFYVLFEKLDLQLSSVRKEQLFAYLDVTGDGLIDQKEFEDGWSFLVEQLIQEAAESLGVSDAHIALILIALATWLLFLFSFIFLAIQGWFAEGNFQSTVQSLFICVSGGMSKALRTKTMGESSHSVTELVRNIMDNEHAGGSAGEGAGTAGESAVGEAADG